ncbi:hypothetical protein [Streptomyces sp. NPDC002889]|uniref:hypothetical protein n=1 Tax=Streptomyces sp. NPDC002889 TaxID=3364669 RepID=UPI003677E3DD
MRVKTSRISRLLASLFAALALTLGGAGIASATSTSAPDSVSSRYCDDYRGGHHYYDDRCYDYDWARYGYGYYDDNASLRDLLRVLLYR